MALVYVLAAAALVACLWKFQQTRARPSLPLPPGPRPDPLIGSESGLVLVLFNLVD